MSLKIIGAALLLMAGAGAQAQESKTEKELGASELKVMQSSTKVDVDEIYRAVQTKPEPKLNTSEYLMKNIKYPEQALQNKVQGKVIVQFVVEKEGSLSDIKVLRGQDLGNGIPEEAIRVISAMPKWKPATQSGVLVRAYFTMPVNFSIPPDAKLSDEKVALRDLNPPGRAISDRAEPAAKIDENYIYRSVQVNPKPAFNQSEYFNHNLLYPEQARENKVQGQVHVEFVVERDGSITNVKVVRGRELANGLPEEAVRVIKAMPKWTPAMVDGKVVRAYHIMPLSFNLQ